MGQKAHPYGLRVGFIKPWRARWFAKRDAVAFLGEDLRIREYLKAKLATAGVSSVEIDRAASRLRVRIFAAKPGVIIGRRGQEIDKIKEDLAAITKNEVFLDIKEVKMPAIDAQLVAENIALQLEKRIGFRRAMKKAVQLAMQKGALDQGSSAGGLVVPRLPAKKGTRRAKCPLALCGPISITDLPKRSRRTGRSAARRGFIRVTFL